MPVLLIMFRFVTVYIFKLHLSSVYFCMKEVYMETFIW